jgi:integrase
MFATYDEASTWLAGVETDLTRSTWLDPTLGDITLNEYFPLWLARKVKLEPKTLAGYESLARLHVLPTLGEARLRDITWSRVQDLIVEKGEKVSASRVRQIHALIRVVLAGAVLEGRIPANPAVHVELPKVRKREIVPLRPGQVAKLADAIRPDEYRPLVLLAAYCGLRAGEIAGLTVGRVNLDDRRVTIAQTVVDLGELHLGAPKNGKSRTVGIPQIVADALEPLIEGHDPDEFVWPAPGGGPMRWTSFMRWHYKPAVKAAGLPASTRAHDLRHTCASLAIRSGASIKAVQKLMGHASAAFTLDVYGHLFADELDELALRLDAVAREAEPRLAVVVGIDERR